MKVLSLFDGISCARVALERVGIPVEAYYASEIDKYATQVSEKNYPDIIRMGDITNLVSPEGFSVGISGKQFLENANKIDLLIGGSPCQDLSIAKKNRKGLDGARSGLFWRYVDMLKYVKPKYFILENVASMPTEAKDIISEALGVQPIMINASLVSAQNRKRLFWTNIPGVVLPEDRKIFLKDVLEDGSNEMYQVARGYNKGGIKVGKSPTLSSNSWEHNNKSIRVGKVGKGGQGQRVYSPQGKSVALSALGGGQGAKTGLYDIKSIIRKLTPVECERLQGLPDNYTEGVSNSQRYKALGNAFNVDVVAHILSFIK